MSAVAEAPDVLMTREEVASLLQVHSNTVLRLTNSGKLPATKVGRAVRYFRSDVIAYLRGES